MEKGKKEGIDWGTVASKIFCGAVAVLLFYLLAKYALGALMPFAAAYLFSLVIVPAASFISKKTGLPKKFCAFLCLTLSFFLFGALLFFGVKRLILEISELLESASRGEGGLVKLFSSLGDAVENISSKFGFACSFVGAAVTYTENDVKIMTAHTAKESAFFILINITSQKNIPVCEDL